MYRTSCIVVTLLLLSFVAVTAAPPEIPIATQAEIEASLSLVPCKNDDRLAAVKDLFLRMGAPEKDIVVEHFKNVDNVVLTVKGRGEGVIVVGAHYDKVTEGCGAIDNWTGIVILANLYRTIRATQPLKSIVFVAFGREEDGLIGSSKMAGAIEKKDRSRYCSMVNLDSFGLSAPQVMTNTSTVSLSRFVEMVAKENQVPFGRAEINADADSSSFRLRGIPAVTIHGLTPNWDKILHSSGDTRDKVSSSRVELAYRFVLVVIGRLDASECAEFR